MLSPKQDDNRTAEIEGGKRFAFAGMGSDNGKSAGAEIADDTFEVFRAQDGLMLDGTGGRFCHGRGEGSGIFSFEEQGVDVECRTGTNERSEVLRVFNRCGEDEERRWIVFNFFVKFLKRTIWFYTAYRRNPLMVRGAGNLTESYGRNQIVGESLLPADLHEIEQRGAAPVFVDINMIDRFHARG